MQIHDIDPLDVMSTPPPSLPQSTVADMLRDRYGIEGRLEPQTSERDQNFRVTTGNGDDYVFKIANSAEHESVTDFQVAALLYLESAELPVRVPRVVRTLSGDTAFSVDAADGRRHIVRMLTWVPGRPAGQVDPIPPIATTMGAALASLGQAFANFEHAASGYPLLWDIKQGVRLLPLLKHVTDSRLRHSCEQQLLHFSAAIEPRLKHCRSQVIFNDLHSDNVLVDPEYPGGVQGIIDFGDIVNSPLVIDVAVASAYLCRNDGQPLSQVYEFLAAYHRVTRLESREFALLPELMLMRNLLTIIISSWRASRYPENRDYILRSAESAQAMMRTVQQYDSVELARSFERHCNEQLAGVTA